ncbi:MAG: ferrochelatase [Rhodothermales bacterium]
MTPRQFLRKYHYDTRLITGTYFPTRPLRVEPGDKVGIVLFHLGGPNTVEDIAPFIYNRLMDPAFIDFPFGGVVRHWYFRVFSSIRARAVGRQYEVIGGSSPVNQLIREQAESLETLLNHDYGQSLGVEFRTYQAHRYWHPFSKDAGVRMKQDGINKVMLLPLFPQYSKTTTGSALLYWWLLEQQGDIPKWPTTLVTEYAVHPKYVQAVCERIDEALQRFPRHLRNNVHLLFSAHGTPMKEMKTRHDPYVSLIHATVDRVMAHRQHDRPFHIAFQGKEGPMEWLTPSIQDTLKDLVEEESPAILVVPVGLVTENIETSYTLDIEIRDQARKAGIVHYEVMPALNCHPLFIEALSDVTVAHLDASHQIREVNGSTHPAHTVD